MSAMVATFTVLLLIPAPAPEAPVTPGPSMRKALANLDYGAMPVVTRAQTPAPAPAAQRERSTGRKILGAVVGGTGGFFAGAFIGSLFTRNCGCDDPGLEGAMYGAPIGALAGAMIGARFF